MQTSARRSRPWALAAIAVLATIALVAVGASPAAAAPIKRGHTSLIFDQNIFSGLDPLGIGMLPTAPAEAISGGEQFPIKGGRISSDATTARINHGGGLAFVGDNAQVKLKRLKVSLNPDGSELIASVGGQRMSFLSLEGARTTSRGRNITVRGIHASFTRKAAKALNQAFATDFFQKGMRLGKLRIELKLAR